MKTRGEQTRALRPQFLEYNTCWFVLVMLGSRQESRASSVLEYLADTLTRLGRTLEILLGTDFLCHSHTLQENE
jgi:hypothetical protein